MADRTVDRHIVGWLLAGSLPGIVLGSCLAVRLPETALRLLLAATRVVVAGKLAYDHIESGSTLFTAFTRDTNRDWRQTRPCLSSENC